MAGEGPYSEWRASREDAEAYERYLVPCFLGELASRLVEFSGVSAGERVLDVGCGTGIVARTAASVVGLNGSITGVDRNEHMLAVARDVSEYVVPPIDWQRQDATALDLPDEAFNMVLSQQTLGFIDDKQAALSEMRRVLTSDGRVAFSIDRSIKHNRPYAILADTLDSHGSEAAGDEIRGIFSEMSVDDLHALVEDAGFEEAEVHIEHTTVRYPSAEEFLRWHAESFQLGEFVADLSQSEQEALVQDLSEALSPYTDDDGFVMSLPLYLVSARP